MRNLRVFSVIFVATFVVAACGGRKVIEGDEVVDPPVPVTGTVGSTGLDGDGSLEGSSLDGSALTGGEVGLSDRRVIYFEYDSSNLTPESEAIVQAHAQYLINSPDTKIILEGHADERGTREYNLSLGEDRAKSVSNLMQVLGVSAGNILTISYGEERPTSLGSDDSAWRLNRRVEILYQ